MTSPFQAVHSDPTIFRQELTRLRSIRWPVVSATLDDRPTPVGIAPGFPTVLTKRRADLLDLIDRHRSGPGDCDSQWLVFKFSDLRSCVVLLDVTFTAPISMRFSLEFGLFKHLAFLERCYELGFLGLSYQGTPDPLRAGVGIVGLQQAGLGVMLSAARHEVASWN